MVGGVLGALAGGMVECGCCQAVGLEIWSLDAWGVLVGSWVEFWVLVGVFDKWLAGSVEC